MAVQESDEWLLSFDELKKIMDLAGEHCVWRMVARGFREALRGVPGGTRVRTLVTRDVLFRWAFTEGGLPRGFLLLRELVRWASELQLDWVEQQWGDGFKEVLVSVHPHFSPYPGRPYAGEYGLSYYAALRGDLGVLRWLLGRGCAWDSSTCRAAARGGHSRILEWARTVGRPLDWRVGIDACADHGRLPLLEWFASLAPTPAEADEWMRGDDRMWGTCCRAARAGRLNVLQWARARDPPLPWNGAFIEAAENGHLGVVKWICAQDPDTAQVYFAQVHCTRAATNGHLDILRWGLESGFALYGVCAGAARGGRLEVLKWARENGCDWDDDGCEWNETASYAAAVSGDLEVIIWAYETGCPVSGYFCEAAAKEGHLAVLRWAWEPVRRHDFVWDELACSGAAMEGHLAVLQWLRALDPPCPWDGTTLRYAYDVGSVDVAEWALGAGCPCESEVFARRVRAWLDEELADDG
jgi:hypothetical protein